MKKSSSGVFKAEMQGLHQGVTNPITGEQGTPEAKRQASAGAYK